MIKSFTLKNFKSYLEAILPLESLTMLIGANASGKSNAIEGLRLLSWLAQGNRLYSIQQSVPDSKNFMRGQTHDLGCHKSSKFSFECEIFTDDDNPRNQKLAIEIETKEDASLHVSSESIKDSKISTMPLYWVSQPIGGSGTDLYVNYNNFSSGGNKPYIICSDQSALFTQLDSPAKFQSRHKESHQYIPEATSRFRTSLSNIIFLDPTPASMRNYSFKHKKNLMGDGSNLSSVLYSLWGEDRKGKELKKTDKYNRVNILKFIRSLPEQDIKSISFIRTPREEVMLQLVETFGDRQQEYDASLLSDGTLRVLAIAAAMLSAPEGGMVVIEEIDNGVHPSRAKLLLEQIAAIADQRNLRVLLSSHNPALLDALPNSAVPHVVFCYRDPKDGSSRLVQLQDIPDYPELIAQGTVGRLMTTGILDRFVKEYQGPEEKRKRNLQWLHDLQKSIEEIH